MIKNYTIGIDEVGRGALAGPVVVAAVCIPTSLKLKNKISKLKDSKQLTAKQREEWSKWLRSHPQLKYAIARVYPRQIEKRNISAAANLAASRAVERLFINCKLKIENCRIFLDGGLFLGNGEQPKNAKTVILADEKIKAVSAASIIAKVHRDRFMKHLAKKYPQYGFEVHKGYGTKRHLAAIKRNGPSDAHRLTFLRSC